MKKSGFALWNTTTRTAASPASQTMFLVIAATGMPSASAAASTVGIGRPAGCRVAPIPCAAARSRSCSGLWSDWFILFLLSSVVGFGAA